MGKSQSSQNPTEQESLDKTRKFVDKHGVDGIGEFHREQVNAWKHVELNFLITGDSGAGKSSFINAVRGLPDYDDKAAKVGVVEMTEEATPYPHPSNSKIIFWDVPGIGTPNYPNMRVYCKKISLEMFDAFLFFCRGRFTAHDLELAKKAKSIGKPFFFVRAHVGTDVRNAKSSEGPTFKENNTLESIRKNCYQHLQDLLACKTDIYLIDNKQKEKWEFDRLIADISNVLPERRRECFILSLANVTRDCLKRKAKLLRVRAGVLAIATAPSSAIPVPIVGAAIDLALIFEEVIEYHKQFGIPTQDSSEFEKLGKKVKETIVKFTFHSVKSLALELGAELGLELGAEEVSKYVPIVGTILACVLSAGTTSRYLIRCIDKLEEAALEIWDAEVTRARP